VLAQDRIADKFSNWLLVDGDRFLAFYASRLDGETTVRRINTKEIVEIVTDPDDSMVPLFYKRQWSTPDGRQRTMYYPDWEAFFAGEKELKRAKLPRGAVRADQFRQWGPNGPSGPTTVCVLHIAFNGKDDDSLYGWPLLAAGSPWIRSQKRHLENRLAVSAAKAMYVRKATVNGQRDRQLADCSVLHPVLRDQSVRRCGFYPGRKPGGHHHRPAHDHRRLRRQDRRRDVLLDGRAIRRRISSLHGSR